LLVVPSSPAPASHAELASQVDAPLWVQIYHKGRAETTELVREVEDAGYRAICVTCDTPIVHLTRHQRAQLTAAEFAERQGASYRVTPADLDWLCNATSLPVVAKGLMTAEDARVAVEHGAKAVFVSNHGGRGFDSTLSTIESLPEVVDAVGGRTEIYLDGGIRRGSDVLKALAMGATAVGIGRPLHWGLAVAGADGVQSVLEILRKELELALARTGQFTIRDLEPDLVVMPPHWE
jgi:isopentenyl diphosphate isomerase/L-lactate dehydrogenase-like FMN-dependent dehydrogenase